MVKDAEKFKEEDAKRQKLEMTKMSIENVSEDAQYQLSQFKDRLPSEVIERIEKAIETLESLRNKGITQA
jgi:molecular chaperone DnaK (HSP70)